VRVPPRCWPTRRQVAYLFAEQAFTDKNFTECINHLDVSQMSRLLERGENKTELHNFLPASMQRLLQYCCYCITRQLPADVPSSEGVADLQSILRDFISVCLPPEMRIAAPPPDAGAEAEPREDREEEPEAETVEQDQDENDFDAFDLSQQPQSPDAEDEEPDESLVEDNPAAQQTPQTGRVPHDIVNDHREVQLKLARVHALSNFEQESLDKVREAIALAQSDDPLFERCGASPLWTALVSAASQWVSEQQAVLEFGQSLQNRIDRLTTQVNHAKAISTLCSAIVKKGKTATSLSTHFHEWWHHSWQKGELVTQAVEFLDEIELVKDKVRSCNKGLGLATKVKDAKDKIHDIFNLAFIVSSSLWWLTVRMITPETPSAEAEPRIICPADAFDQYARMWEETREVLSALEQFGLKMPRAWTTTLRASDLRRVWLAFGSQFLRVLVDPTPLEASKLVNMKELAAAAEVPLLPSLPNTSGADKQQQQIDSNNWAELSKRQQLLMKRVARDLVLDQT